MNRGHVLQSSPVQQMAAAGNPNWWSMMRPPPPLQHQPSPSPFLPHPSNLFPHQYAPSFAPPSSSPLPNYFLYDNNDQDLHRHESLSQLLLGGLVEEELDHHHHKSGMVDFDEVLRHQQASHNNNVVGHVKQETSSSSYNNMYGHGHHANQHEEDDEASAAATTKPAWSPANMLHVPSSFPKSCLSNVSTNMLDFSTKNDVSHPRPDRSSESNSSTGSGGAPKKARVQHSSTQSSSTTIKVRKEKLGDRITNLHQLVSPFGKTDTASVLLEAIGYIRFLQNQIEALSLPYLGSGSGNNNIRQLHQQQQSVQGDRNCLFPEDPGQLLNDNCLKRKGAHHDQACNEEPKSDLRSKGLCLVPVSCMLQVGSDNGADYWAPALGAGAGAGFR